MQRWSEALLKLMRHCDRHAKCHHSTSTSSSLQPLRKRTEHSLLTIDYQKIGGGGGEDEEMVEEVSCEERNWFRWICICKTIGFFPMRCKLSTPVYDLFFHAICREETESNVLFGLFLCVCFSVINCSAVSWWHYRDEENENHFLFFFSKFENIWEIEKGANCKGAWNNQ